MRRIAYGLFTIGLALSQGSAALADPTTKYTKPAEDVQADTEGPRADVSGTWLTEDCTCVFVLRQEGDRTYGKIRTKSPGKEEVTEGVEGVVKGRVFIGNSPSRYGFTLAPDGQSGTVHIGAGRHKAVRFVVGPAADDPRTAKDPYLSGGVIYRVVWTAHGPSSASPLLFGGTFREAVVLSINWDLGNEIGTFFSCVPIEPGIPAGPLMMIEVLQDSWVRFFDPQELRRARARSRVSAKRAVVLEGRPAWWVLVPVWGAEHQPSSLHAELYREDPDEGGKPVETVIGVASRTSDKGWQAIQGYLRSTSTVHIVTIAFENGLPAGVEATPADVPPLTANLLTANPPAASHYRWYTQLVLKTKEKALPKLLRDSKNEDLLNLTEELEKHILNLNRFIGLKQNSIKTLEGPTQVPTKQTDHMREMVVAYQERIDVIKPILAAIKEEMGNRGK